MATTTDAFDALCQQVFMTAQDTSSPATATPSIQETALAMLAQAQPYELPSSYVLLTSTTSAIESAGLASAETKERTFYRIHLENIDDPGLQQSVQNALVLAIDPGSLVVLPFDRNLSGYSSKTRTESKKAPLDQAVLLDMADVSSEAESSCFTSESQQAADSQGATPVDDAQVDSKTMLLVPTTSWIRMTGRIRYWRAESHRIKAAQREVVLDELLNERWKLLSATNTVSSPPPSSGSLLATIIPPTSLPSSPISSSASSSPASSPRPTTGSGTSVPLTRSSNLKQPFQEHQLDSLVQFMKSYGDEPSVAAILRGLLDLIRRQLTQPTVLSWTFDRANLTEQKPEATVAFLDLIARLGLELQIMTADQKQRAPSSTLLTPASSDSTITASSAGIDNSASGTSSTELTWTFGTKADDRRLEYLIHHIQQTTLPVLKMDSQSLLPSTASFIANESTPSGATHSPSQNPVPAATRKRFLQGQSTIPAGSIKNFTTTNVTGPSTEPGTSVAATTVTRERSFVLSSSRYALTADAFGSLTPAVFVHRVKRDVKDLARWASTCGGRLDWIWAWLFSSFQKSRHGSSSAAAARKPRSNDENV
ncbi:hypothetical protein KVV02_005018 [Mortierella alpina]|uniref:Uncharacterized protein n=1 Tax=Mortierella alpina TaxID=64518 RepID=A0A9P8CYL3_MORAP|nr:hypothetical protein KVV02_005018 [Mortierella alpina]